jgi:hypothetical protein
MTRDDYKVREETITLGKYFWTEAEMTQQVT